MTTDAKKIAAKVQLPEPTAYQWPEVGIVNMDERPILSYGPSKKAPWCKPLYTQEQVREVLESFAQAMALHCASIADQRSEEIEDYSAKLSPVERIGGDFSSRATECRQVARIIRSRFDLEPRITCAASGQGKEQEPAP